jgi:hypothetical protein
MTKCSVFEFIEITKMYAVSHKNYKIKTELVVMEI